MHHNNELVNFLRHYGPIPTSDNMYDELIQAEIERYGVSPPIHIKPACITDVINNFESNEPSNIILTGTAGDGKTYHCRRAWEHFGGDQATWQKGEKVTSIKLQHLSKTLVIIKDLSELTQSEKQKWIPEIAAAITETNAENVFLVAANDGQLLASWRDWSEESGIEAMCTFRAIENMLVENRSVDKSLKLQLYNLSRLDPSKHFEELLEQIVEHPQWENCKGCELMKDDGASNCPIRINRDLLKNEPQKSTFRSRVGELLRLASANRMHLPIRDLILLGVNILLGDRQPGRTLLTCKTAKNRAADDNYRLTNPYANAFGENLPLRQRQQYQVFTTLESFGVGRETDNKFDNLLIYGAYDGSDIYKNLVENDKYYGARSYKPYLRDYLEGERHETEEFMRALSRQRQRLFFSLPTECGLDPWCLTVYRSSGNFLDFVKGLADETDVTTTTELLVRGLNRTFCGMMIDDSTVLHLASSGGDGRGRIASILSHDLPVNQSRREPYVRFGVTKEESVPWLLIVDPADKDSDYVDKLDLQLTHFEYLIRVANGSLPASFSRQCHEDFLDFKLRVIKRLDKLFEPLSHLNEVSLKAITVDERGRAQSEDIRIRIIA